MIKTITVKNYALIKALHLDLYNNFTTITGETGAGKSILLGALGLILGNRAESKVLADETTKCVVEAQFFIAELHLQNFFATHELDYDDHSILRREILPSGKSRAFINDTPVKLEVLKNLGSRLVDIHSQHDSMLMMNPAFQLEMLDAIAQNQKEMAAYSSVYGAYQQLKKERSDLEKLLQEQRDTDYLQFLVDELETANLQPDEEVKIDEELQVLRHAEDIQNGLGLASSQLNDEFGILEKLHEAAKSVESIARYFPEADGFAERLRSAEIELKDVAAELDDKLQEMNLDEGRLIELEERHNFIQNLFQKHHASSCQELLEKFDVLSEQLLLATSGAQALAKKDAEIAEKFEALRSVAKKLSDSRQSTAKRVQKETQHYLDRLQLQNATLSVGINFTEKATATGFDDVQFLFSANTGSKPQPINKVASGGELSRVMLALKAILAKTQSLPAIIFDEIDTGISGQTAQRAATILQEMGENMQVMAITHLPQIAAQGKHQLKVQKASDKKTTETTLNYLSAEERVEEIARLLSGDTISAAARQTAEELLVG